MIDIKAELLKQQDIKYRDFQGSLIPNVERERIIGVRTRILRAIAAVLYKENAADSFISALPHYYFEENQIHAFIISFERDFEKCIALVEEFLPYIDNWATCDQLIPISFKQHKKELLPYIEKWIKSDHTYTVRFGIVCLMKYFLDECFDEKYPKLVSEIKSDEYYVKMAVAWYFATALAKQYDAVLPFIAEGRLDKQTHNKTIQKAQESFMISNDKKAVLKGFKR